MELGDPYAAPRRRRATSPRSAQPRRLAAHRQRDRRLTPDGAIADSPPDCVARSLHAANLLRAWVTPSARPRSPRCTIPSGSHGHRDLGGRHHGRSRSRRRACSARLDATRSRAPCLGVARLGHRLVPGSASARQELDPSSTIARVEQARRAIEIRP